MTIPTREIQALRNRAQEALAPVPYQQARLHIGLERDRPVRFAAMKVKTPILWKLFLELDTTGAAYSLGLQAMRGEVAVNWNRGIGHWPAAQIVELCDAVLERRRTRHSVRTEAVEREYPTAAEIIKVAQGIPEPPKLKGGLASAVGLFGFAPNGKQLGRLNAMAKRAADRIREQGTPARIKTALLDLPFVDSVRVEENRTLDTVDGMPPKSVRVTVGPPMLRYGALEEIAHVFHRWLPVGVATVGSAGLHTPELDYNWNWAEPHCGDDLADSFALAVKAIKGPGGQPAPRLCSDCKGPRRGLLACERCNMVAVGGVPLHLASGEDLDRLGELIGVERAGDTDKQYRARIELEATDPKRLGACYYVADEQGRPCPVVRRPMAKVGAIDGVKARTFAASDVKATLNGVELEPAGDIVIEPVQPGEPTEAERRERLRREMAKGKW
jgi:hypothetical protein